MVKLLVGVLLLGILVEVHSACQNNSIKCKKNEDCCDQVCIDASPRYCRLTVTTFMQMAEAKTSDLKLSSLDLIKIVEDYIQRSPGADVAAVRSQVAASDKASPLVKQVFEMTPSLDDTNDQAAGGATDDQDDFTIADMMELYNKEPELARALILQALSNPETKAALVKKLTKPETMDKIQKYLSENKQLLKKGLDYAKKNPQDVETASKMLFPYRKLIFDKLDDYLDQRVLTRAAAMGYLAIDLEAYAILAKLLGGSELALLLSPVNEPRDLLNLVNQMKLLAKISSPVEAARLAAKGAAQARNLTGLDSPAGGLRAVSKGIEAGVALVDPEVVGSVTSVAKSTVKSTAKGIVQRLTKFNIG